MVIVGSRVVARAFTEAYRQAAASAQYAKALDKGEPSTAANNLASHGLTLDEACKILNVAPPKGAKTDMESVLERFKRLYDANDPTKGGSFYLQSKILRARERIQLEVKRAEELEEAETERRAGWKPKMYKDR